MSNRRLDFRAEAYGLFVDLKSEDKAFLSVSPHTGSLLIDLPEGDQGVLSGSLPASAFDRFEISPADGAIIFSVWYSNSRKIDLGSVLLSDLPAAVEWIAKATSILESVKQREGVLLKLNEVQSRLDSDFFESMIGVWIGGYFSCSASNLLCPLSMEKGYSDISPEFIHGIGSVYAEVLKDLKVDSTEKLAFCSPGDLQCRFKSLNPIRRSPGFFEVVSWVLEAQVIKLSCYSDTLKTSPGFRSGGKTRRASKGGKRVPKREVSSLLRREAVN